jgi:hypothetical protein
VDRLSYTHYLRAPQNTARDWAMLDSTTIRIVLPLLIGLLFLRRSEVK